MNREDEVQLFEIVQNLFWNDLLGKPRDFYKALNDTDLLIVFEDGTAKIFYTESMTQRYLGNIYNKGEKELTKIFGLLLKKYLENKRMPQWELARRLNTSQQLISDYVNGKKVPSYYMLKCIADVLGCKVDDLYLPISYSREKHALL